MADLQRREPGTSGSRAWLGISRWGMCWRVTVASAFAGMLGALLLGLIGLLDSNSANIFFGLAGVFFGLLPAPIFGGLAALIGPWLSRFLPVSQGLLFGAIGVVVCAVLLMIIDGIDSALRPCPPTMGCFAPFTSAMWVLVFAGIPLTIMSGVGWGLATYISISRRRTRIFSAVLMLTVIVFASAQISGLLRPLPDPRFEEPPGPVCGVIRNGEHVEVPCG